MSPWDIFLDRQRCSDKTHPEHEEMVEWVGGSFDPEWIDIEEINVFLKARGF